MVWNEWEQLKAGTSTGSGAGGAAVIGAGGASGDGGRGGGLGAAAGGGGAGRGHDLGTAGSGGGGTGGAHGAADLIAHQDDLGAVGHEAYLLHAALSRGADIAGTGLNRSGACSSTQAATALRSHHFAMGTALATTVSLWTSQLTALLQACAHISNHLDHTKASHARDDAKIRTRIHGITAPELPVSRLSDYFK